MSDLPEPEIVETTQVTVWRMSDYHVKQYWRDAQWRIDRNKDLQDIRGMLSHLTENEDWFFVEYGHDVDVCFTDAKQAMMIKLRLVL